jgi:anti-sigma B factor antagonist
MLTTELERSPLGHVVIRPIGELDALTVTRFRHVLAGPASWAGVVIDLSRITFMDSAGLGALIGGIRHRRERGSSVAVSCDSLKVSNFLRKTGFDRITFIASSPAEAAATLAPARCGRPGPMPILVDRVDDDPAC